MSDDLAKALISEIFASHVPVKLGLRAQGHIPTIERLLADGASWDVIGRAIGWHGDTARQWYERETTQGAA